MINTYNYLGDYMFSFANKILWSIAIIVITYVGLGLSFKLKGTVFNLPRMFKSIKTREKKNKNISSFESLMMALGGRIGVGSIAGIAMSIYYGGVGSIFWMIGISCIVASSTFAESVLSKLFRIRSKEGYIGGPSFYIEKALNKKKLAYAYSIIIIIAYIFGFLSIQANTICRTINQVIAIKPFFIGLLLSTVTFFIIKGGVKKISLISAKVVPFMGVLYFSSILAIIIINIEIIPKIFFSIFTEAFNFKALGFGIISSLIIGIQRGIFSNEACLGTSAIASASSTDQSNIRDGYFQVMGVFITTLIISLGTALVIMTLNMGTINFSDINGIEITYLVFKNNLGIFGEITLVIAIILFAFSTIISGYYYGESSLIFLLKKESEVAKKILQWVTVVVVVAGSLISATFLWQFVDMFVAILAIINSYSIFKLKHYVIKECQKYDKI